MAYKEHKGKAQPNVGKVEVLGDIVEYTDAEEYKPDGQKGDVFEH